MRNCRSRSSKAVDYGTNRKDVCSASLTINTVQSHSLTAGGHSRSFKVINFGMNGKALSKPKESHMTICHVMQCLTASPLIAKYSRSQNLKETPCSYPCIHQILADF